MNVRPTTLKCSHSGRRHKAFGLCNTCYQATRKESISIYGHNWYAAKRGHKACLRDGCENEIPLAPSGSRGRSRYCSAACAKITRAALAHARYLADPAAFNARGSAYYAAHRDRAHRGMVRLRYNLPDYAERALAQDGKCGICGRRPRGRRLNVDHDHRCCPESGRSCGRCIRGLLCNSCNGGRFPENPAILRAAANYFERFPAGWWLEEVA